MTLVAQKIQAALAAGCQPLGARRDTSPFGAHVTGFAHLTALATVLGIGLEIHTAAIAQCFFGGATALALVTNLASAARSGAFPTVLQAGLDVYTNVSTLGLGGGTDTGTRLAACTSAARVATTATVTVVALGVDTCASAFCQAAGADTCTGAALLSRGALLVAGAAPSARGQWPRLSQRGSAASARRERILRSDG